MSAFHRMLAQLAVTTGHEPRGAGRQRMARCPAHQDGTPSLSITAGSDRVLLRCHGGCDTDDVLAAL
ncbi:MAG: virulence-associated protein E, partial [Actinomycetota bacterium]|nr:virulence-associated protein E [Actinomycetota bacterium]